MVWYMVAIDGHNGYSGQDKVKQHFLIASLKYESSKDDCTAISNYIKNY